MEKVEKRHIQKIEEDENSVTIKFGKSENYEEMEREGHDDKEDKGMHDDDKKKKELMKMMNKKITTWIKTKKNQCMEMMKKMKIKIKNLCMMIKKKIDQKI